MEQGTMVSSFINLLNTLILYLCAYIIPIHKFILKKFNLIQPKHHDYLPVYSPLHLCLI